MGFSRQEYWSGLPCPSPGDLPNPRIEPQSLALQADSLPSELQGSPKRGVIGDVVLDRVAREGFSEVVTFEQRHKWVGLSGSSPSGSSVHGILQVRILEWVAMPFSRGSS